MSTTSPAWEAALRGFAAYYGFDYCLLDGGHYRIEGATDIFDGRVTRIRVMTEGWRFGNIFMQLLHAAWLARQVGCHEIEACAFEAGPRTDRVEAGGISFLFPRKHPTEAIRGTPTLVGFFFRCDPFESALRRLAPEAAWDLVQDTMRPLFRHICCAAAVCDERTLVIHFRAGDVFRDLNVNPWYVQPPAAFYTTAIAHARQKLNIEDVRLVFEDRANPAIALTESWLRQNNIPFSSQSEDLERDATCLTTAAHLVASVSTFVETAAMLSSRLRTYITFRQVEAFPTFHQRTAPLVAGVLRRSGAKLVLIKDREGCYTPICTWRAAPDQLQLIAEYPESALAVAEGDDSVDMLREPELLRTRLQSAEIEAARLRDGLLGVRDELAEAREEMTDVRDQLEATQAQLVAVHAEKEAVQEQLAQTERRLTTSQEQLAHLRDTLHGLEQSRGYRLVRLLRRIRGTLSLGR